MDFYKYQKEAMRTAQGMNGNLLANGAMGLAGETAECVEVIANYLFSSSCNHLDKEHLSEEIGDILWYLAVIAKEIGYFSEDNIITVSFQEKKKVAEKTGKMSTVLLNKKVFYLVESVGKCTDLIKKHLFQGHSLEKDKLTSEIVYIFGLLAVLSCETGYKLSDIAENNVQKLKKRYPDGFSTEKSINRE